MRKLLLLFCILPITLWSQVPGIRWQNTLNASGTDFIRSMQVTPSGDYLIAGTSNSDASPDKAEKYKGNGALNDYWIVKMDRFGHIIWENTIGGKMDDWVSKIIYTPDGGSLVAGSSMSNAGADKAENSMGLTDYWVVKLGASGNILWQNTIGGPSHDYLTDIIPLVDGGYMLMGESISAAGGDKTEAAKGSYDYWLVKIDASGNVVWQKAYGGSDYDYATGIESTADGGYLVAGYSKSPVSGDKTLAGFGQYDYWVLKINASGTIIWQQVYGSSANDYLTDIAASPDGNYVLIGQTDGGISGNKTTASYGLTDYWLIKIDPDGNIVWQTNLGGSNHDFGMSVAVDATGNIYADGTSISAVSGVKTQTSYGADQWIVKLNSTGTLLWDRTLQDSGDEQTSRIAIANDGGLLVGGGVMSNSGYDKIEPMYGYYDYWLVQFEPLCATEICNGLDDDCDGVADDGYADSVFVIASGPTSFCKFYSVDLTAYYTSPTIQWQRNGINIAGATSATYHATKTGDYRAVATTACDVFTSPITHVIMYNFPVATIAADGPVAFCAGGSVNLYSTTAGAAGDYTYTWYKGPSPIAGATNSTYTATTSGNYKLLVTPIISGCADYSNVIAVSVTCKTEPDEMVFHSSISPNPSDGMFTIEVEAPTVESVQIEVWNMSGAKVFEDHVPVGVSGIDLSALPAGLYQTVLVIDGIRQAPESLVIQR